MTQTIKLKPDDAAYLWRGVADYNKGDYAYTKAYFWLAQAYCRRGEVYHAKGDYSNALSDYAKAIKLNPNDTDAYFNRGYTYYQDLRKFSA